MSPFLLHAALLVLAETLLPGVAERFAGLASLSQTLVGNLFMAVSTSLPEVVVSGDAIGRVAVYVVTLVLLAA